MLKQAPAKYNKIRTNQPAKGFFLSTFPDGNSKQDFMKAHPGTMKIQGGLGWSSGTVVAKNASGVLAEVRKKWRLLPPRQVPQRTRHEEHVLLPFFWRVVLSQVHQVSRWTGWNATYKHKRCKPQSRSTARGSKRTGTTQQKLRSGCGKIGRIMENKNGRNARGCGIAECSASGLLSSLLFSAVVLTRCWYQRICVFACPETCEKDAILWPNMFSTGRLITHNQYYSDHPEKATQTWQAQKTSARSI